MIVAAMTRRRPAAAGPIPGRSVPPGHAWGVLSEGPLPANRRPAVPTRVHQSGGQPTHAAPARHADYRARPPPANRPSVDHHKHHGRGAQAGALTLTAVPTSERFLCVSNAWVVVLIGQETSVDGVRLPPLQSPQRFFGRLAFGALAPVVG